MKFISLKKSELKKFFCTSIMMMMTLYIYSILRVSKDAIIINSLSAELISTVKLYGVLPSAVIFMLIYSKVVDLVSRTTLYHIINACFIAFFVLFAFVLYPHASDVHFELTELKQRFYYLRYLFIMIENWSFSLYYVFSELWGSIMISLLFWQLANQITHINEAKKVYPLFGLMGQIGLIASGKMIIFLTQSLDSWSEVLVGIVISIVIAGLCLSAALLYLCHNIVGYEVINGAKKANKKKAMMSFVESMKYIFSSKYVGLIALIVICYGVSINLVEGVWKKALGIAYPDPRDLGSVMGSIQVYTGFAVVFAMLCGAHLLRVMSWRAAALFTPFVILITGALFFAFFIFRDALEQDLAVLGATSIMFAAYFGALQNMLSKATKYAFFDPAKEMAYIPLDEQLKAKGKAAADVIGGRLGKLGGAFIQWAMIAFIPGSSLVTLAPNIAVIFAIMMILWIVGVFALSREFEDRIK